MTLEQWKQELNSAARSLASRRRSAAAFAVCGDILIISSVIGILTALAGQLGLPVAPLLGIVPPVAATAAGWLFVRLSPLDESQTLLETDRILGLKERLTAAWEILGKNKKSALEHALLKDAAERVREITPQRVYPFNRPPRFKALPPLLLVLLILSFIPLPIRVFAAPDPLVHTQGEILEEIGEKLAAKSRDALDPDGLKIAEELQRLGKRLQDERMSREKSNSLIQELQEKVQQQVSDLERDLVEESLEGTSREELLDEYDEIAKLKRENMSNEQLQMLRDRLLDSNSLTAEQKEQIKKAFEDAEGEEGDQRLWLSEELMEELGIEPEDERLENLEDTADELANAQKQEGDTGNGESTAGEDRNESSQEGSEGPEEFSEGNDMGGFGMTGEGEEGDGNSELTGPGTDPGQEPMEDEAGDPYRFQRSETQRLSELRGEVREEKRKQGLIRSMPTGSPAEVEETRILQNYQRELEEVIQREEIPVNMRQFVRDYFLNIGIGREQEDAADQQ